MLWAVYSLCSSPCCRLVGDVMVGLMGHLVGNPCFGHHLRSWQLPPRFRPQRLLDERVDFPRDAGISSARTSAKLQPCPVITSQRPAPSCLASLIDDDFHVRSDTLEPELWDFGFWGSRVASLVGPFKVVFRVKVEGMELIRQSWIQPCRPRDHA